MKKLAIIGIIFMFLVVELNGCVEELDDIETVDISGVGVVQTINKPGKKVRLDVSGVDCDITVTKETNLTEVDISGVNCIVRVSRSHSFVSDISGVDSKIIYYD